MVKMEELVPVVTRPAAWLWIRERYLPSGPICPGCGAAITGARARAAWLDLRRVYCAGCGFKFAPTAGTPLADTSWQPEEFLQLLLLTAAGRRPAQIAAVLGKSAACIRDMLDRIQLHHSVDRTLSLTDQQAPTGQG